MKKKYFVRLIAALPMFAAAISMVVFVVMAFDNAWWALLVIGDFWAFMRLAWEYECNVRSVSYFLKEMANDALHE